jgi:hypothetical protein
MSTVYPERAIQTGDPLDADAVSDTLQRFADEMDGNLGEMNWAASALTSTTDDLETDAVLRVYDASTAVDWTGENAFYEPVAGPTGALRVPISLTWNAIITASLKTCRGGTYRVVFSAQQDAGELSNDAAYWSKLAGCAYAVRVDGTVYEESVVGGSERSNDPKGEALYWDVACVDIEICIPLAPGQHTFEVVARMARMDTDSEGFDLDTYYEIFNRSFYIVEHR